MDLATEVEIGAVESTLFLGARSLVATTDRHERNVQMLWIVGTFEVKNGVRISIAPSVVDEVPLYELKGRD